MSPKKLVLFLLAGILISATIVGAQTTIPDIEIQIIAAAGVPVSLFSLPDGTGRAFPDATAFGGGLVNATITMVLLESGQPVASFPAEDMWLENNPGSLAPCVSGTSADISTDANGVTYWIDPLGTGGTLDPDIGHSVCIVVNGSRFPIPELAEYRFNSPDITGDGVINLSDVVNFSEDFYGSYAYRSDFQWDGMINLTDVAMLAHALNRNCP